MPMLVSGYEGRDAASSGAELGFGLLALCRAYRGTEGVRDARYWMQSAGRLVLLVETEQGVDPSSLWAANPEITKAGLALMELASNPNHQLWGDPRDGAAALAAGAS